MSLVTTTITVVVGAMAAAFLWADRLLIHPSRGAIPMPGVRNRTIDFRGHALEMSVAHTGGEPAYFVLMFTGNAERAEVASRIAIDQFRGSSTEIWSVNYPGFGASEGSARIGDLAAVGLAAYDAFAAAAGGRPIVVCGTSLGATVALHVARHRRANAMVLITPPPLRELILSHYAWWNLWLLALPVVSRVPDELDALANAREVHVPAVFVVAQSDGIVPTPFQMRVVEAYAGERRVVTADGGHGDWARGEPLDAQREAIRAMLAKL